MNPFKHLSFVLPVAIAGLYCLQTPPAIAAATISVPAVESSVPTPAVQAGYYYYHGRRYPYRYRGIYFNHRYYRGGRYHYY